ncbi:ATP synthase subunit [Johnsonella ignava ATCC 51276]|jgi:Archaeal/vacuolar-type H+-ATPase subunit F|uniref:ATP synthase subunit n=1 Tax=Johnsonella ignava ATCC 51276 TaxID=679200 RepID=G5GEZ0_9FIRM|nr:V-type ATP synthase subunit F [Johnsonella ignava]EHI56681.1 ATP synthase subunit [Johnsonella ignava ATCC 51276]
MKMYLISDNIDTIVGMRLAGVEGSMVENKTRLKEELDRIVADNEVGIVLLMEKFSKEYPEIVNKYKLEHRLPLFIDIPDRHGTGRSPNFITDYVNEAIGLKL